MKTTYLKPVLDLAATGTKIKTLMMQKGITPRQLQIIMDFVNAGEKFPDFAGLKFPLSGKKIY